MNYGFFCHEQAEGHILAFIFANSSDASPLICVAILQLSFATTVNCHPSCAVPSVPCVLLWSEWSGKVCAAQKGLWASQELGRSS